MPKQVGIFKISGTMDDATFYKTQDGLLVRTKGGVSASRIKTDPSFERTRENMSDFAYSAQAMRLVRNAVRGIIGKTGDNRTSSRLIKKIREAVKVDSTHARGQRTLNAVNLKILAGFEFNESASLLDIIGKQMRAVINRTTGMVSIDPGSFVPKEALACPSDTNQFRLVASAAIIDFAEGDLEVIQAESDLTPVDTTLVSFDPLALPVPAATTLPILVTFGIQFFNLDVDGALYQSHDEGHSAFKLITVSAA